MKENLLEKNVFMRASKFLKECRYCELQKRRFSATGYFSATGAGMLDRGKFPVPVSDIRRPRRLFLMAAESVRF